MVKKREVGAKITINQWSNIVKKMAKYYCSIPKFGSGVAKMAQTTAGHALRLDNLADSLCAKLTFAFYSYQQFKNFKHKKIEIVKTLATC